MWHWGIWLVAMVGMGQRLDLMTLVGFFNLYYSVSHHLEVLQQPYKCLPRAKCSAGEGMWVGVILPQQWAKATEAHGGGTCRLMVASPCRWCCGLRHCCCFKMESGEVLWYQGQVAYKWVQQPQLWDQRKRKSQNIFVFNLCLSRKVLMTLTQQ